MRRDRHENCVSLRDHVAALRAADQHALKIKEEGDAKALDLSRTYQTYKDEKANELREQIGSERGLYVTRAELEAATARARGYMLTIAGLVIALTAVVVALFVAVR